MYVEVRDMISNNKKYLTDINGNKLKLGDVVLYYENDWDSTVPVWCFIKDLGRAHRWYDRQMTLQRLDGACGLYVFYIPSDNTDYIKKM